MSFDQIYEKCFRNISLVKNKKSDDKPFLTTLDYVMTNSAYVIFLMTSSSKAIDVSSKIEKFVTAKNASNRKKDEKPQSSPARIRRLFSLKKKKKVPTEDASQISVVVVDTDFGNDGGEAISKVCREDWYVYAPQNAHITSRLLRTLGFEYAPCVSVVESSTLTVVTKEGRRLLNEDEAGNEFPWWPPTPTMLLNGKLCTKHGNKDYKELQAPYRAFFFGAFWCPPARQWAKQLSPIYEKLRDKNELEVIFCSSDRNEAGYNQFLDQMPWPAFAYDPQKTSALTRLFNVNGIPAVILTDAAGNVFDRHGKSTVLDDALRPGFSWKSRLMYEMTENSVSRLRDEPSLVLFTEGSPDDVLFSISVLQSISNELVEKRKILEQEEGREDRENENRLTESNSCSSVDSEVVANCPPDNLQFFYTGEDPICDHILEKVLGLEDAELPLLCVVDALAGELAICQEEHVSEQVVRQFVTAFHDGKLQWQPLPTPKKTGTTPELLQQADMVNSPSTNSLPPAQV